MRATYPIDPILPFTVFKESTRGQDHLWKHVTWEISFVLATAQHPICRTTLCRLSGFIIKIFAVKFHMQYVDTPSRGDK
jgi:hypothetical protein